MGTRSKGWHSAPGQRRRGSRPGPDEVIVRRVFPPTAVGAAGDPARELVDVLPDQGVDLLGAWVHQPQRASLAFQGSPLFFGQFQHGLLLDVILPTRPEGNTATHPAAAAS